MTPSHDEARRRMVETIATRGIVDQRVLGAMSAVPREIFVPEALRASAYDDAALSIEAGQTISQPYIVALMVEAATLAPTDRVLEVGTGSGYAAAVIARLCAELTTVERHAELAHKAAARLAALGVANATVVVGDGSRGHAARAPYDAVLVAAAAPSTPAALAEQLAIGGRLIAPVGPALDHQTLRRVTRAGPTTLREETLCEVRFVPLIGEGGWPAP